MKRPIPTKARRRRDKKHGCRRQERKKRADRQRLRVKQGRWISLLTMTAAALMCG